MKKIVMMLSKRVHFAALVSIVALFSASANATPVDWYLSGVTFTDGGTASGSFTYDADTSTYSAISISTTAGSIITTAKSYDVINSGAGCSTPEVFCLINSADVANCAGKTGATFTHVGTPLTNAGGTIALTYSREYTFENFTCSTVGSPERLVTTGSFTSELAPTLPVVTIAATTTASEPSTNGLFTVTSDTVAGVGDLIVTYEVQPASTAIAGVDYAALSGAVNILEGETTAVIPVVVIDDAEIEVTETVTVNVTSDDAYTLGSPSTATVNITSDDVETVPPPTPTTPVPTMSQWALIVLSMLLGLMVFANRRRLF